MKTLGEFIVEKQHEFSHATGELTALLSAIKLGAKIIHRDINKAGLVDILGASGAENVQGEVQQKLDLFANEKLKAALKARDIVAGIASEEEDEIVVFEGCEHAKYVVLMDPLDYTTGCGVHAFTYDPSLGVFCLCQERMRFPEKGKTYSINEGNYIKFPNGVKKYIKFCQEEDKSTNRPYTSRYIGSLVADFHRNLLKGGIYLYPSTASHPDGKLRLLYECNPMAFLAEQAGGKASDGKERILDIIPETLHQRRSFFVGNDHMVEDVERFIREFPDA